MPTEVSKHYWDSCVFLSYVNATPGRVDDIDALLSEAERGAIEVVTSVLSIAEVAFGAAEQANQKLDPAIEERINALWEPASPINLIEVWSTIAEDARTLMRSVIERGWSLKAFDAFHLCSARRIGAAHFVTYDEGLEKYGSFFEFDIGKPVVSAPQTFTFDAPTENPNPTAGP